MESNYGIELTDIIKPVAANTYYTLYRVVLQVPNLMVHMYLIEQIQGKHTVKTAGTTHTRTTCDCYM